MYSHLSRQIPPINVYPHLSLWIVDSSIYAVSHQNTVKTLHHHVHLFFHIMFPPYVDDVPMETSNNTIKACKISIKNILKPINTY